MTIISAAHWSELDTPEWRERFPNFAPWELKSRNGSVMIVEKSLMALQGVRFALGLPMHITSAYRTRAHNRAVRGSRNSQHLKGHAYDIALPELLNGKFDFDYARELESLLIRHGFTAIGRYPRKGFMHTDMRPMPPGRTKLYQWGPRLWPA